jgi:hypothetical protein
VEDEEWMWMELGGGRCVSAESGGVTRSGRRAGTGDEATLPAKLARNSTVNGACFTVHLSAEETAHTQALALRRPEERRGSLVCSIRSSPAVPARRPIVVRTSCTALRHTQHGSMRALDIQAQLQFA